MPGKTGYVTIYYSGRNYGTGHFRKTVDIRSTAVSYTHLDVYKRQSLRLPFSRKAMSTNDMPFLKKEALRTGNLYTRERKRVKN